MVVATGADRQLDPLACLQALGSAGINSVFCEGGGALAASLLGAEGWPAFGAMGLSALAQAPRFALVETRALGGDVLHHWRRADGAPP